MALVKPGPIVADLSGNLGGINFVRNATGLVVRQKLTRRRQRTPAQLAQRAKFAMLTRLWRDLAPSQRTDWDLDASLLPRTNRLGTPRAISGFALFLSLNCSAFTPDPSFWETHNVPQITPPPTYLALDFTSTTGPYNVTATPNPTFPEWQAYFGQRSHSTNPVFHPDRWRLISVDQSPIATEDIQSDWDSILGAPSAGEVIAVKVARLDVIRYPGQSVHAISAVS